MATATVGPRTIRRAMAVSARTDDILEGLTEAESAEPERHGRLAQAYVLDCSSLSAQWRAQSEYIADAAESGEYVDYRALGEILLPACQNTLDLYKRVALFVMRAEASGYRIEQADLVLAKREIQNIIDWIDTWPTNNPARRNAAREAIARGDFAE